MSTPLVELKDVSKVFRLGGLFRRVGLHVISNVSLTIESGEIVCLVGESGCGKTTLGRIVLGLVEPTSGEVLYGGERLWNGGKKQFAPPAQIVHQDSYAALNPVRTVYQSISAPLLRHGVSRNKARERAEEILMSIGLNPPEYFLTKYPHHLSGGQRQRLVLARSAIPEPRLIVADEPVSMVDMSLRLSVLDMMLQMNQESGMAFLYITHDLATARYIGRKGRMAVMYLGTIVEEGELQALFDRPLHPYLQALLSAAPVPDPRIVKKRKPLRVKEVELPDLSKRPTGCAFHPRCPYEEEICSQTRPELREYEGHRVACHLAERIPVWTLESES